MEKDNSVQTDQAGTEKRFYVIYIIIGVFYVAVKIIFVSAGYLHPGAILHGAIPALATIAVGALALKESKKLGQDRAWHTLTFIFPLLVLVTTPVYMYLKEFGRWLENGRLGVLIIYEVMAVLQFLLVLLINRAKNRNKDKL